MERMYVLFPATVFQEAVQSRQRYRSPRRALPLMLQPADPIIYYFSFDLLCNEAAVFEQNDHLGLLTSDNLKTGLLGCICIIWDEAHVVDALSDGVSSGSYGKRVCKLWSDWGIL